MSSLSTTYRRYLFLGIILIALGVTFSTTLEGIGSLGTVFIAVGGLFFIIAMSKKRSEVSDSNNRP